MIQSPVERQDNMIDLQGAILQDINLRGAYFRQADLSEADLTGADLFGVSLESAWLKRAIVRDTNLYSVNLHWRSLHEADLRGTTLVQMNATSAFFCGADIDSFEFAILIQTNFRDARMAPNVIWSYGNFVYNTTMPDGTIKSGPFFGEF